MHEPAMEPMGVILAGGRGRRLGGDKAVVELGGEPLIGYPLAAMAAVLSDVAVLAKADTTLPELPGVEVWIETDTARHPLVGVLEALRRAAGRPVMICAADMPFITPELIAAIALGDHGQAVAVVASHRGALQPLLACYQSGAAVLLAAEGARDDVPLRSAVAALAPLEFEVTDPELLFNVNAPADLERAAALLSSRR